MIRFTALLAIIVMALFGSAVALAEEPDATYKVRPGRSVTFVTPPLSFADRLDCEERFASDGHHLQRVVGTKCSYGATETRTTRNLERTACRGPFTYSLPLNYGKLDPDAPDSARNVIVRPNGARWTVAVPDETQIGEVFRVTILIEGVNDIYFKRFNNPDQDFELSSRGAGCNLTKTVDVEVVAPTARSSSTNHKDTAPLAGARAAAKNASPDSYIPPNRNRCTVVQFNRPHPTIQHDKPSSTGYMSWCGDLGEYAPNGRRLADLCAEANVDCRRY